MSRFYNIHDVSHQFAVSQGSELGILGMLVVLLLAWLIAARFYTLNLTKHDDSVDYSVPFLLGAFTWITFAMTANIPVSSGPTMPWIGALALFLAFSQSSIHDKRFGVIKN